MRTTVRLDDELLREVKMHAAEQRMTLTAVLEKALRELLARRKQPAERLRVPLPSFMGQGLQPGVDLDDSSALLDLMESRDAPPLERPPLLRVDLDPRRLTPRWPSSSDPRRSST